MEETMTSTFTVIRSYVPSILSALAILIVGYLVAMLLSRLVKAGLSRTRLDNRFTAWMQGPNATAQSTLRIENTASQGVFWIVILFVVIGALQTLGLGTASQPLGLFLNRVFDFLPRLIPAAILAVVAWVVASVVRIVVGKGLAAARVDERLVATDKSVSQGNTREASQGFNRDASPDGLTSTSTPKRAGDFSVSKALSETSFWLVLLLFLPAIVEPLQLNGPFAPILTMINKVFAFLPNLLAGAVIFAVGLFGARLLQRIVSSLLSAAGLDRFAATHGMSRVLGNQRLSQTLGTIAMVLVLIPVLIAALNALQLDALTQPASQMLNRILTALPNVFAAGIILAIAYVVARVVARLAQTLLASLGFDALMARMGFTGFSGMPSPASNVSPGGIISSESSIQPAVSMGRGLYNVDPSVGSSAHSASSAQWASVQPTTKPSELAGTLVIVAIMLFAAIEAFNFLGMVSVAALVVRFTAFFWQAVLASIIVGAGLLLADFAARIVKSRATSNVSLLAAATRLSIIVLSVAMALEQLGIAPQIINLAFGLSLGAIAVACALAFGLGGREQAGQVLTEFRQNVRSRKYDIQSPMAGQPPTAHGPTPYDEGSRTAS